MGLELEFRIMLTEQKARAEIDEKIAQAEALITECEKLAKEAGIDFCFVTPCGRREEYDGGETGYYGPIPTGWDHSQC
jgi:hypothetical protein